MNTTRVTSPKKYFAIILFVLLYLFGLQLSVHAQSKINPAKTTGYFGQASFRVGAEVSKHNSLSNSITADPEKNFSKDFGMNLLTDVLLFDKRLAITTGAGVKRSSINISQANFIAAQNNQAKTVDGISDDPQGYIQDDRMYASIPFRVKWRSNLLGGNKKMYIGSGVNYYRLLTQDALIAYEDDGVTTNQGLVVEVPSQNQKLDLETQVGFEISLASSLVFHAGVVYSKGLISPYEDSGLMLNNLGLQTGVYF